MVHLGEPTNVVTPALSEHSCLRTRSPRSSRRLVTDEETVAGETLCSLLRQHTRWKLFGSWRSPTFADLELPVNWTLDGFAYPFIFTSFTKETTLLSIKPIFPGSQEVGSLFGTEATSPSAVRWEPFLARGAGVHRQITVFQQTSFLSLC